MKLRPAFLPRKNAPRGPHLTRGRSRDDKETIHMDGQLRTTLTKRQQLYANIAARHTPDGVRVVTLENGARTKEGKAYGMAHRWPEDEEEEENFVPWMEVPEPTTIRKLWTYLHDSVYMGSAIPSIYTGNNYSSSEAEAELGALRILESEGIKLPLRHLKATRRRIDYEARKDRREFGAEYSPLVLECLGEFDRRIVALEMYKPMQTHEEQGIRDWVKGEYGMTMGESDRWCAWVDLWNLDEKALKVSYFSSATPVRSCSMKRGR
jgi:hypothetical protein